MIKNDLLKDFLQNSIFRLLSFINKRLSHNKSQILLYSNLGFRDNIKALFDYIIENKYNEKYAIICSTNDYKRYKNCRIPNVKFVSTFRGIISFLWSGYVFYCFGKIPIQPGLNQEVIQMWHGSFFKSPDKRTLRSHSICCQYYTHVFAASKLFAPICSKVFAIPLEKIIICGNPRNDVLFSKTNYYDLGNYHKTVIWAPTFRQSRILGYRDSETTRIVPLLDKDDFSYVNLYLKEKNIIMIIKLHPLQDVNDSELFKFSHLKIYSHEEFVSHGFELYKLCSQTDALITDYSSLFLDYLLLNRPIAFTEDDIECYTESRGFAVDNPEDYKVGRILKNKDDLMDFINNLYLEKDDYKEARIAANDLANEYHEACSCKRALNSVGIEL